MTKLRTLGQLRNRSVASQLNIKLLVASVHNLRVLLIFFDFILFPDCPGKSFLYTW